MSSVLTQLQQQCADRLQADPLFANVRVLTERIADIQSEIDRALGPLNESGGKTGIVAIVVTPTASVNFGNVFGPFLDEIKSSGRQFTFEKEAQIKSFEARRRWDPEFLRKYAPSAIFSDSAPKNRFCWAHDRVEVGRYWYGFDSVWLPETLLAKEQQEELADALHSASRHWPFEVQFSKGFNLGLPSPL